MRTINPCDQNKRGATSAPPGLIRTGVDWRRPVLFSLQTFLKMQKKSNKANLLKGLIVVRALVCVLTGSLYLPVYSQTQPLINSTLDGKVVDKKDKTPLIGVNIKINGTTHMAQSDARGRFKFVTGQKFPYTLTITYLGYKTTEVVADGSPVEIQLEESSTALNNVVIVGYGSQKKSDLTGAISTVSGTTLKQPLTSVDQMLKGASSGVQVTQTSGQPGGGVSIRIRGGSSVQGGNEPLYVIDGFPIYNSASSAGVSTGAAVNPLASIDPADIESVTVLKDASSTAIYGSRGANGVIIVTTRKGSTSRSNLNYDVSFGSQKLAKKVAVLNAHDFAILRNDALYDTNPALGQYQYRSQQEIDQLGEGTNWQNEAFRTAPQQTHQLSLSGGSEKVRYLISGGYTKQDGILRHTDFSRISFRSNLDANPFEKLKVGLNISASRADANVAPSGIISGLLIMPPTATVYEPDGSYTLRNPFENIFANPIASLLEQQSITRTNRVLATSYAEYKLLKNLSAKILFGADVNNINENSYIPKYIYEGSLTGGSAGRGSFTSYSWLNENTLNYNQQFGKHSLDVLAGFTQQEFKSDDFLARSQRFVTDDLGYNNLQGGATLLAPASDATSWVLHSLLSRINYSYNSKYYFTASLRSDGSSRFGAGNKWGYFPSLALGWKISEEPFFQPLKHTVNELKLRSSFGKTGNLEIGEYQSLATLYNLNYVFGGNISTGFLPNRIANNQLGWESTRQFDIGLDVSLFDSRVSFTADAYLKKTSDLLLNVEIPWTTGYATSLQNFGSVQNKGFEFSVNSRNLTGQFKWNTSLNISFNRNKVLSIGNGASSYISGNYIVQVGSPLGSFYGNVTRGILQSGEESTLGKFTGNALPKAGDRIYKDVNGDGVFTTAADKEIIGNAQPDYIFGLSNNVSYKGFELSLLIQGSVGNKILNGNRQALELFTGQQNAAASALERWTPANPSQTVPRAKLDPAPVFSDRFIEDGSFLRVKDVTLGYNFSGIGRNWGAPRLYLYVGAQNLLTWTRYTGFDPEVTSGSNVSPGTDTGIYPIARSLRFGLRATF